MPSRDDFTLDDFIAQMSQVQKLGPMGKVMGLIPGMGDMMRQVNMKAGDIERSLRRMRAAYDSMTPAERAAPEEIDHARRRRVARGAGLGVGEVAKFVRDFEQSREMMRAVGGMGVAGKIRLRNQLSGVLGLVGESAHVRDPSYVLRPERPPMGRSVWMLLGVTIVVVTLIWGSLRR